MPWSNNCKVKRSERGWVVHLQSPTAARTDQDPRARTLGIFVVPFSSTREALRSQQDSWCDVD